MFKSFMVSREREQKASDVSASHAGPSRLGWWNLEQSPGWIFIANNFYRLFFTAEKVWSKWLQYVADSKSLCAFKILLGQSVERGPPLWKYHACGKWELGCFIWEISWFPLLKDWWAWDNIGSEGRILMWPFLHFSGKYVIGNRCCSVPVCVWVGHREQEAHNS